jgi:hypothetical protein
MWDPVYFNYGIAVHGALNVPLYPASHGCIRLPLTLSPTFQDLTANGDQVFVFDGVEEPEFYGAQLPVFNWIDPDYSTTTSSTTQHRPPGTVDHHRRPRRARRRPRAARRRRPRDPTTTSTTDRHPTEPAGDRTAGD